MTEFETTDPRLSHVLLLNTWNHQKERQLLNHNLESDQVYGR
jgi:hypothetical protein